MATGALCESVGASVSGARGAGGGMDDLRVTWVTGLPRWVAGMGEVGVMYFHEKHGFVVMGKKNRHLVDYVRVCSVCNKRVARRMSEERCRHCGGGRQRLQFCAASGCRNESRHRVGAVARASPGVHTPHPPLLPREQDGYCSKHHLVHNPNRACAECGVRAALLSRGDGLCGHCHAMRRTVALRAQGEAALRELCEREGIERAPESAQDAAYKTRYARINRKAVATPFVCLRVGKNTFSRACQIAGCLRVAKKDDTGGYLHCALHGPGRGQRTSSSIDFLL